MENISRAGQAIDDNVAQEHCVLYNQGSKDTLRLCNTLLFHCKRIARTHVLRTLDCLVSVTIIVFLIGRDVLGNAQDILYIKFACIFSVFILCIEFHVVSVQTSIGWSCAQLFVEQARCTEQKDSNSGPVVGTTVIFLCYPWIEVESKTKIATHDSTSTFLVTLKIVLIWCRREINTHIILMDTLPWLNGHIPHALTHTGGCHYSFCIPLLMMDTHRVRNM